jgi:AcrR family transcriptional regulator
MASEHLDLTDDVAATPLVTRRLRPSDRRAEIVAAARQVFLATGYAGAGLAEVAAVGAVSRGSIYRYFPNGRVDLFLAVTEDLLAELHGRLRYAASVPFSPAKRMEHLIAAMFAFFQEEPNAYRLLFRDVWAAGEASIEASAAATRALLTAEIAGVIADAGVSADELTATSAGIFGFTIANIELALNNEIDPETAWSISCRCATALDEPLPTR